MENQNNVGPEEGLRSGSTAGDSHGQTADAPDTDNTSAADSAEENIGERRKEMLREE